MKKIYYVLLSFLLVSCSSINNSNSATDKKPINDNNENTINLDFNDEKENKVLKTDYLDNLIKNSSSLISKGTDNIDENYTVNDTNFKNIVANNVSGNNVYVFESFIKNNTGKKIESIKVKGVTLNFSSLTNAEKKNRYKTSHGILVLKSFLDTDLNRVPDSDNQNYNINIGNYSYNKKDLVGIINMSYGNVTPHLSFGELKEDIAFINAIPNDNDYYDDYFKDDFSNLIFYKDYVNNNQLKIKSLGNTEQTDLNTFFLTNSSHNFYATLSTEMQKAARSETIYVKNMLMKNDYIERYWTSANHNTYTLENGKKYYEVDFDDKNNSKALLLRSFTAAYNGLIKNDEKNVYEAGSSFSAPRITRLAYDLKNKYPFLSYHQIKQVILTSSDTNGSGYLDTLSGWGIINRDRALKGFSNFNAGLIEESKFFAGNYDKIFDNKGNIYEYINIDNNQEYEFSNDIDSGLDGDGNTKDYYLINVEGFEDYSEAENGTNFRLRIPKVIDSEKLFYKNIKQAGLRKDGLGSLILSGKQLYKTQSEVLAGTLKLRNDSHSSYKVYKNANLLLENGTSKLYREVINGGNVSFNSNLDIKKYVGLINSTTIFDTSKKVRAEEFIVNGNITFKLNEQNIQNKEIKDIVSAKSLKINGEINNLYLEKPIITDRTLSLPISKDFSRLSDITKLEKRNIPSYLLNENRFFEEFTVNEDDNEVASSGSNNLIPGVNRYLSILNLASNDKERLKAQIFTDNYSTFVSNIFENEYVINKNLDNILNLTIGNGKKYSVFFNNLISTNIAKNKNYEGFRSNLIGNLLGLDIKINDFINSGIYGAIYNSFDEYTLGSKFNTSNYQFGIKSKIHRDIFEMNNSINYTLIDTKITRNIEDEEFKNRLISNKLSLNTNLKFNFKLDENNVISPFINLSNSFLFLNEGNEKNDSNLKDFAININKQIITKTNISSGLEIKNKLNDKINISNQFRFNMNINEKNGINVKMNDVKTTLVGKSLEKYVFDYSIKVDYAISDNLNFKFITNIDTNNKLSLSSVFKYEF